MLLEEEGPNYFSFKFHKTVNITSLKIDVPCFLASINELSIPQNI
jgi:hypothetical protein